ncbi:MAG: DUF2934 domain-containing protein [Pontiellaceae bacterium]|nr:DUF2934 domain-containing protein [Pontiellaceae bacterium]
MAQKKVPAKKTAEKNEVKEAPAKKTATKKAPAKKAPAKKPAKKKAQAYTPEQVYSMIEQAAYFAAENDGFQKDPSVYWGEAEASIKKMIEC